MSPRKIDPQLAEILRRYGADPKTDVWDCHGTWVAYHRTLERIAATAGIRFDFPQVLEANGAAKSVAVCVEGAMAVDGKTVTQWSIGEAAPGNNKNAYPYAMAEKRAKDRVVLKLIGLHGFVYSEDEIDKEQIVSKLIESMKLAETKADAQQWGKDNSDVIDQLNESQYDRLIRAWKAHVAELPKEQVAA